MKRLVLLCVLFTAISFAGANPIVENLISRFWFEEDNVLKIELSRFFHEYNIETVTYLDAEDSLTFVITPDSVEFHLIQIPESCNTPAQGYFTLRSAELTDDAVHWGEGLENDLSPLYGTQCAIQMFYNDLSGDGVYGWAKDISPSVCGSDYCSARFTLQVICTDLSGLPVAGVSVFHSQSGWGEFNNPIITNGEGIATDDLWPMKTRFWVKNPLNDETVFNTLFFAEPSELKTFSVQLPISVEDSVLPSATGKLIINPSVLNMNSGKALHIVYDQKISGKAELILYDLKGRKLAATKYAKKEVDWLLPKLANGIYFVRLTNDGKALGTAKLIVIK